MKLTDKILGILTADARTPPEKIAVMLGAKTADVVKEIETLEKSGVIVKYGAVINEDKLERETVEALIEVKVSPQFSRGFDAIAEEIYKLEEVSSLYLMSGTYDLTVIVKGKSLKAVAAFVSEKLSGMDKVLSTATHFILKKYKCEGVVMDKDEECRRLAVQA